VKPHPLSLCGEWGSLGDSLYRAPTFGNPATSLLERSVALRPRLAAGLPLSRRRSAIALVNYFTNLEPSSL
jgi:hypothetical protein